MIKTFLSSIREYKKYCYLTPIFVLFEVILEMLIPFTMSKMIDIGIKNSDIKIISILGSIMVLLAILSLICGAYAGKYAAYASTGFSKNLRNDIFAKVQTYSFSNIDKFSTSSLITRITTDVGFVQMAFQMSLRLVARSPLVILVAFVMASLINITFASIFLLIGILLFIVMIVVMKTSLNHFSKLFRQLDFVNRDVEENLSGARVVKSFVTQDDEIQKLQNTSSKLMAYATRAERIISLNRPFSQGLILTSILLIAYIGSLFYFQGDMTTGDITALYSYVMLILVAFMLISQVFLILAMARISAGRIYEVLKETPSIKNPENSINEIKNADIEYKDVYFKYNLNASGYNLENININIKSGSVVGIIGPTGSGKSTFVNLIPRLYEVTKGEVRIGGVNIKEYDLKVLRDNVSFVLQKNLLFSGTIKENLLWGNENASMEEIIEATKKANAYDFIMSFPQGFDHDLGQGGVNVSGGQRQRLCIARALLKNPKVLILDDSTSAVDTKTDASIRHELKHAMPNVTKIIISQRISSIKDADMIIVFDNGKISSVGTHDELLKKSELYGEINELQSAGGDFDD